MARMIMNYDDLKEELDLLVIDGRRKFYPTGKYDIESYEKYINENARIIVLLAKQVKESLYLLKDERIIRRLLQISEDYLIKAFEESLDKNPKTEYVERFYKQNNYNNYIHFLNDDIIKYTRSNYSKIIEFMNITYTSAVSAERTNNPDSKVLYDIFNNTKKACASLGIHSPNAEVLYNFMTTDDFYNFYDPERLNNDFIPFNVNIDFPADFHPYEEETEEDPFFFKISSIPYYVTIPHHTKTGLKEYEIKLNDFTEFWINNYYKPKYSAK